MSLDYLKEAKNSIGRAQVSPVEEEAMVNAQLAIACAGVAQTELLAAQTELLRALIERLDAFTVSMVSGEKALQTYTYVEQG